MKCARVRCNAPNGSGSARLRSTTRKEAAAMRAVTGHNQDKVKMVPGNRMGPSTNILWLGVNGYAKIQRQLFVPVA